MAILKETDETIILVSTVSGNKYRVEGATNVTGPWTILADHVAGTGTQLRVVDPPATGMKFYRATANQ
jgi:hypothetical protein